MEQPVTFQSEGQQVVGMLHLPEDSGRPVPAVVFLHGFTGNKQEPHRIFVQVARSLAEKGVASLRFDLRGCGDSAGEFVDMTLSSKLADARAATAFVRAHPDVDAERTGLVALSMGGVTAAYLLAEDHGIKAAALWAAVADGPASVQRKGGASAVKQLALSGVYDMDGWAVGRAFVEELVVSRPVDALAKTQAEVLLIHGDEDETVPIDDTRAYEAALKKAGGHVVKHVIKGADHTFNSLAWADDVVTTTVNWLTQKL